MKALHLRLTLAFAILLTVLAFALLLLLNRTSERYSDEVLQRLNADIGMYVVRELPLLEAGRVNETALRELGRRAMTVNPSTEVYLLDPSGQIISTLVPSDRLHRHVVRLAPLSAFLNNPDRRPVYGDDPASVDSERVFSVAPIRDGNRVQGYLYVVLGGAKTRSITSQLSGSYTLRSASTAVALVLMATLLMAAVLFAVLTRRLRDLDHRMQLWTGQLPESTLGAYDDTGHGDEISALTMRFHAMSTAIERQIHDLKATDELRRELIANVSHDLRTPLASLRGYIETLLMKGEDLDSAELCAHLNVALRQTDQLGRLIDALFELAKLESGAIAPKCEPFVIAELLQDVALRFRMLAHDRGTELHTLLDNDGTAAFADIELIERVMSNLLQNALRYTPSGGQVRIEMSVEFDVIRVRVVDTGSGIEPQHLPRIFDRYYSSPVHSDRDRAGLGLAIVKRIMDLHGQSVRVLSGKGTGTTVEFSLAKATGLSPTIRSPHESITRGVKSA